MRKLNSPYQKLAWPRIRCAELLTSMLFALGLTVTAWAQEPFSVLWRDGQLTIHADHAPLSLVLLEVVRQAEMEIHGLEGIAGEVSVQFAALSLRAGLQRLLTGVNYLLVERMNAAGEVALLRLVFAGQGRGENQHREEASEHETAAGRQRSLNQRLLEVQEAMDAEPERATQVLHSAVQDPDPTIRQQAYSQLYERGEKATVASLLRQDAVSADSERRRTAIDSLGSLFAIEAVDLLRIATTDEHPDVRHAAFEHLAHIDDPDSSAALVERLTHPDPAIRALALEALASQDTATAREAAQTLLEDGDEELRGKAANLLHALDTREGEEAGE